MLGGCFSSVQYACEDDAQCRVSGAAGVCAEEGYCAYQDPDCESGLRYGPFAGSFSEACVGAQSGSGTSTGQTGGDVSSSSADSADPSAGTSGSSGPPPGSSSSDATGCGASCGDLGEILWTVADDDTAVFHGVTVFGGELLVAGAREGAQLVQRRDPDDGAAVADVSGVGMGTARDIAALAELLVVVGEQDGALQTRATAVALDPSFGVLWSQSFESAAADVFRAVSVGDAGIFAVGAAGGDGLVVAYDTDGLETLRRIVSPEGEAQSALLAVDGVPDAAVLGGTAGSNAWMARLLGSGSVVDGAAVPSLSRVHGVASVGPVLDILVGEGEGEGRFALLGARGTVQSGGPLPGGTLAAVESLEGGGWVAVGTDARMRPWFTVRDADGEALAEDVLPDVDGPARALTVSDGVAYVVGGQGRPWVAAVAVGVSP